MVFGKFAKFFWAWKGSNAASARYMPTSVASPHAGFDDAYASSFYNSGRKNNLRPSSSLQDLSTYRGFPSENVVLNGMYPKPSKVVDDDLSSFSKEKSISGGVPFSRRKWTRAILFLLCLMLFGLLIYAVSMYISREGSKYYVVLDCGSTGTRVYVYQASLRYRNDGSLPIVVDSLNEGIRKKPKSQIGRAYHRMETEPGFDKLVHNFSGLKGAINPLIQWAEKQIPEHAHKSTSLFLYATAGVRRLPPADSKWIIEG